MSLMPDISRDEPAREQIVQLLQEEYGVSGSLSRLAGENINYLIHSDKNRYVLKLASRERSNLVLDMEHRAEKFVLDSDLELQVPRTIKTRTGKIFAELAICPDTTLRARLLRFLAGTPWDELEQTSNELLMHLGETLARLDLELSNFTHPAMHRTHQWDLTALSQHRCKVSLVANDRQRRILEWMLHRCAAELKLRLPSLPKSFIHNDANDENLLVEGDRVVGLLDFGDSLYSPVVCDLAITLAYVMLGQDEPLAAGSAVVAGYHRLRALTEDEQWALFPLACGRLANTLAVAVDRRKQDPDHPNWFVTEQRAWELIDRLYEIDPVDAAIRLNVNLNPPGGASTQELLEQRRRYIGPSLSVAYREPLKMIRGRGQYLFDHRGRAYLDLVNNICHVGHCHPRVVEAGQKQMARLNTNTRYLYDELTQYAARICSTLPRQLNTCFFVNSGSEANELALRLARIHTGRENFLVVDGAYHGNTSGLVSISPYKFMGPGGSHREEPWVHMVPMADGYRGRFKGQTAETGRAYAHEVSRVAHRVDGGIAAFITEPIWSCGGQVVPPDAYVKNAFEHVREAGGLCIVDEVQVGFGRVGRCFWGFQLHRVVPDIVVMGKPMGNGHPLAAVVTSREIAASFDTGMEFFSSFGGNPVSCAIGIAVLDVIESESLQDHARTLGDYFLNGLRTLAESHDIIGDVRGAGLFIGAELVKDRQSLIPATEEACLIVNSMKDRGVLLSTDGAQENVLKIKPPMVITEADVAMVLRCLDDVLRGL